jgi:hypothetical protein
MSATEIVAGTGPVFVRATLVACVMSKPPEWFFLL